MGQGAHPQLPVHPAGHQRGIHPGLRDGAVRNGQQVCARRLQLPCPLQISRQVCIAGGVQLNGNDLFARIQLAQEGVLVFHRFCLRRGKLFRPRRSLHFGQGVQRSPQGRDVGRCRAAAAAQNADHAVCRQPAQFLRKIFRLALIPHLRPGHDRVARIRHHRQRQYTAQAPGQRAHRAGGRHTVQAHRIHAAALAHPADKVFAIQTFAGVAVRQHRKRDEHKGVRLRGLECAHSLQNARIRTQRLKQEVLCSQLPELLGHRRVDLRRRERFGLRSRAKVCKHEGSGRCRCRLSQLPARFGQRFPARRMRRRHPGQAEGIGLDGIRPGFQIFPVDCLHPGRVSLVRPLALNARCRFIIGTHTAIEQQRPAG